MPAGAAASKNVTLSQSAPPATFYSFLSFILLAFKSLPTTHNFDHLSHAVYCYIYTAVDDDGNDAEQVQHGESCSHANYIHKGALSATVYLLYLNIRKPPSSFPSFGPSQVVHSIILLRS